MISCIIHKALNKKPHAKRLQILWDKKLHPIFSSTKSHSLLSQMVFSSLIHSCLSWYICQQLQANFLLQEIFVWWHSQDQDFLWVSISKPRPWGVLSFESYPRTKWLTRSAKNFCLGGSLLGGTESMLGGWKTPLSDISNCCLEQ